MSVNHQSTSSLRSGGEALWPGVRSAVVDEATRLTDDGVDITLAPLDLGEHYQLPDDTQRRVSAAIEFWAQVPHFADTLLDPDVNPTGAAWRGIAKRAVALHPFYNAHIDRPSDGISDDFLDIPLFDGSSARDLTLQEYGNDKGPRIINKYETFLGAGSLWGETDSHGLSAGAYIAGSVDRIADVTRAKALSAVVREHVSKHPEDYHGREFVSASLACGAAEPVFWLAKGLEADGIDIGTLHLVDGDPIALAASTSRADAHGLSDKVALHRRNLLKTPIDSYIAPDSVDVVDLIGLYEYLDTVNVPETLVKRVMKSGPLADVFKRMPETFNPRYDLPGNLLADAAKIVRPGGLIVFGNMLDARPQQEWFSGIWPPLHQRSISQVIDMVEAAGFSREQLKITVPENEGVYGLYTIEIPKDGTTPVVSPMQRALGKIVTRGMPEY